MSILPLSTDINLLKIKPFEFNRSASFGGGLRGLPFDSFQKSEKITKIGIRDINNNPVDAYITEEEIEKGPDYYGKDPKKFSLHVDGKRLGYAIVYTQSKGDGFYLKDLYTEEDSSRHYKGAGTELLKCAVRESQKRGFEGRLSVCASHIVPPFVFYYKNNFTVSDEIRQYNAPIDYAARNNIPVSKVMQKTMTALSMELDKKGAKALLEGRRLYKEIEPKKLAEKVINGQMHEAYLVPSIKSKENYFFIVNKDAKDTKMCYAACIGKCRNSSGKKCLKIYNMDDIAPNKKISTFAYEAAQIAAQKQGCKKAIIKAEYQID